MLAFRPLVGAVASLLLCASCATTYTPPGRGAKLQEIAPQASKEGSIQDLIDRKPAAGWPATVALVRVQAAGYHSSSWHPHSDGGKWTVVGVREVEKPEHLARVRALSGVRDVVLGNSLIVPEQIDGERDLREAAARLQADLLVLYTFDTAFRQEDDAPLLTLITLGMAPTRVDHVTSTAQYVLLDVRSGFFYASGEATERRSLRQCSLLNEHDFESERFDAETAALDQLVTAFERTWPEVVARHGGSASAAAASAPAR